VKEQAGTWADRRADPGEFDLPLELYVFKGLGETQLG
jgi:hypothetical protein